MISAGCLRTKDYTLRFQSSSILAQFWPQITANRGWAIKSSALRVPECRGAASAALRGWHHFSLLWPGPASGSSCDGRGKRTPLTWLGTTGTIRDHQGPQGTTGPRGPGGSAKSKSAGSQCLEMLDMLVGFVVGWLLCRVVYSHGSHGQVNPGTHAPGRSWYWFVEKLDLNCRAALSGARWGNSLVEFSWMKNARDISLYKCYTMLVWIMYSDVITEQVW